MNTTNFPRLRPACDLAAFALALALGIMSCGNPAQGRTHTVTVQVGHSGAARIGGVFADSAVASVTVDVTDPGSNPVGSITLTKKAGYWGGSIELTGTGLYTFAATAKSAGGGKMYTGSYSQNIPTDGLTVSIPVSAYTYLIGDTGPGGGLVFYDNTSYTGTPAWRYMEAAPSDQSSSIQWWNGTAIMITTATAVGTGKANTAAIIAAQGAGTYAASLCADYSLGGYSDWFMPSKDELNAMYTNLATAGWGGFGSSWYWSSSQATNNIVYYEGFAAGFQATNYTYNLSSVRAVRAF